jgi:lysophospholipase L1-like esterase
MKKLILFLLPLFALAQNPTNFPYGIKNTAATTDNTPAYFTTTQVDGVHKKTPAATIALKTDLDLKQTVFTGICQKQYLTENDIVIDNTALTLTIATVKNGTAISPANPVRFFTDGSGIAVMHEKTAPVVFNFTNTTGVWYFYFNSSGTPIATQTVWNDFSTIATVYRFYWNATLATADKRVIESVEYHKNDISWASHTLAHLDGTKWANGLDISSNAISTGTPNPNGSNAVIALSSGTNIDDNLLYTITNAQTGTTKFTQDLGTGLLPATSGKFITITNNSGGLLDKIPATDFPFLWNATTNTPEYLTVNGTRTGVTANYFFVYYVYALQDPRRGETIKIKSAETDFANITLANAHNWEQLQALFPTLRDGEIRLMYKLTFEYKTAFDVGTKKTALRFIDDLRKQKTTTTAVASGIVPATNVSVSPIGGIASTNAQSAFQELDVEKENVANKSDSYTASSSTTYASTKALVDGLDAKISKISSIQQNVNSTLTASANDQELVGLEVYSVFNPLSFTGVRETAFKVPNGLTSLGVYNPFNVVNLAKKLVVNPNLSLGNNAGDYTYISEIQQSAGLNLNRFQLASARRVAGSNYEGSAFRLQYTVDNYTGTGAFVEIGASDPTVSGSGFISLSTSNQDRLSVLGTGQVLINKLTNSGEQLQVAGTGKFEDDLYAPNITSIDASNIDWQGLGDSITYGQGSTSGSTSYADIIQAKVGFKSFVKQAVSGATLVPTSGMPELYTQVMAISAGTDLVTFMAGVNDYTWGTTVGNFDIVMAKSYASLDRTLSFTEAFRFNIETIKINHPNAKLIIISPLKTTAGSGAKDLQKYIDVEIAIANYFSIPFIDANNLSAMYPIPSIMPDGLHPNDAGYALLADCVLKGIVNPTTVKKDNFYDTNLIGTPTAPTATAGTNTTQIATTAFVQSEKNLIAHWTKTGNDITNNNTGKIYFGSPATGAVGGVPNIVSSNQNIVTSGQFASTVGYGFADQLSGLFESGGKLLLKMFNPKGVGIQNVYQDHTSGTQNDLSFVGSNINPTSGNAVFNNIAIESMINQTGGANGITRGIYINPTLTSAADFRAIEVTNGKSIFQEVIANNVVRLKNYTVATLPTGTQGDTAFVTDALAPTYMATIVGGGAVVTPVFYNGTAWVAH